MRFALIFALGMLLIFSSVLAQSFSGGVILAANFSQIDGDNVNGYHQPGLAFGTFVNYAFTDKVSLQPEFHFRQIGSRLREKRIGRNGGKETDIRVNVFDLPIVLVINTPIEFAGRVISTDLFLAPVLGVQLNWRDVFDNQMAINYVDRYDFRMTAGLALHLTDEISIDLRVTSSFSPFLDVELEDPNSSRPRVDHIIWYHNYVSTGLKLRLFNGWGR